MNWTAKATEGGGDFQNPEPGPANAVCVKIIDRGTDPNSQSQYGPKRKLMVSFEIDQTMSDGRPFIVNKFLNVLDHYGEKSGLRLFFESWRGKKYAADEDIDIGAVLGAPAMLSLVSSPDGKYVNIDGISRLHKSTPPIKPVSDLVAFNLDDPDWDAFSTLSERQQEAIMRTPEYKKAMGQAAPQAPQPASSQKPPAGPKGPDLSTDFDDDLDKAFDGVEEEKLPF